MDTSRITSVVHVVANAIHATVGAIRIASSIAMPKVAIVIRILLVAIRRSIDCIYQSPVTRIEAAAAKEEAKTARLTRELEATKRLAAANTRLLEAKNANSQLKKRIGRELNSGWESRRPK